jgi:hypothetical protein
MEEPAEGAFAERWGTGSSSPLGAVRKASNHIAAGTSESLHRAAINLVDKAARAVADGDEPRAVRYVERAVRLPFDERDQIDPGWWWVHMLMFTTMGDVMEDSEADDPAWLDAAEGLLDSSDTFLRATVLETLAALLLDHKLPPRESRRIKKIIGDGATSEWVDVMPTDVADRVQPALSVVRAIEAYRRAMDSMAEDSAG